MFKKQIDFKSWVIFFFIVIIPAFLIYRSTATAYPGMLDIVAGMLVMTVGLCGWVNYNSDEPDDNVRKLGLVTKGVLAVVMVFNLWGHVSMTREISAAEDAERETRSHQEWKEKIENEKANRELQLTEARVKETQALTDLQRSEARKLNALPLSQRRYVQPVRPSGGGISPETASTPALKPVAPSGSDSKTHKTAADVREEWRSFFTWALMIEVLIVVVGGAAVMMAKKWDANGNNIPDWIERIFKADPHYVRDRWPHYYASLQSPQMGNSPA